MKKIVILKTGETLDTVKKEFGDFDNHIIERANLKNEDIEIINCKNEDINIDIDKIKGIIITGSHSMVTDYEPWSVNTANWIKKLIDTDIPMLGICYGHQLLADALGGKVDYNPNGLELGTATIELTDDGLKDKLLGIVSKKFKGHVAHSQTVVKLPKDAKLLAFNKFSSVQAFSYKDHIWGLQFHPEFCSSIVEKYIDDTKKDTKESNQDFDKMYNSLEDNNYGKTILNRFIEISNNK